MAFERRTAGESHHNKEPPLSSCYDPVEEASMIPNYEVTLDLSQNDWQTLARGRRITDQKSVLIKTLRSGIQGLGDGELLEREFHLLSQLSIYGIPRALDLQQSDNGLCLVMEDGGGVPL